MPLPIGRKLGSKNLLKKENIDAICERMHYEPEEAMIRIASGDLPCLVCYGRGQTHYAVTDGDGNVKRHPEGFVDENGWDCSDQPIMALRRCQSCYGRLREHIPVAVLASMVKAIFDKRVPDLRPVDFQGNAGDDTPRFQVVFLRAPQVAAGASSPLLQAKKEE